MRAGRGGLGLGRAEEGGLVHWYTKSSERGKGGQEDRAKGGGGEGEGDEEGRERGAEMHFL